MRNHRGGNADFAVERGFAGAQALNGIHDGAAAGHKGGLLALFQFIADAFGERQLGAVGFCFEARHHGFEVVHFGLAFAQNGRAAGIVELEQNLVFFYDVAFFDSHRGLHAYIIVANECHICGSVLRYLAGGFSSDG